MFQGGRFRTDFFCNVAGLGRVDEKQPIETKAVESLKEIGRRLARFPLKVDCLSPRKIPFFRIADGLPTPMSTGAVSAAILFERRNCHAET
jgi:hypothetical protein